MGGEKLLVLTLFPRTRCELPTPGQGRKRGQENQRGDFCSSHGWTQGAGQQPQCPARAPRSCRSGFISVCARGPALRHLSRQLVALAALHAIAFAPLRPRGLRQSQFGSSGLRRPRWSLPGPHAGSAMAQHHPPGPPNLTERALSTPNDSERRAGRLPAAWIWAADNTGVDQVNTGARAGATASLGTDADPVLSLQHWWAMEEPEVTSQGPPFLSPSLRERTERSDPLFAAVRNRTNPSNSFPQPFPGGLGPGLTEG